MEERKHLGKSKNDLIIPVAPNLHEMNETYFHMRET